MKHSDEASLDQSDTSDHKDDEEPPTPKSKENDENKSEELQENASHEDFHGKKFSNQTHRSTTGPDSRLYKKTKGQETYPGYLVHNLTDVESGIILKTNASIASGKAEREISLKQLVAVRFQHPQIDIQTLSGDKAYGTPDYLVCLFSQGIIPLVSLRDYDLEEPTTWKRETNNPECNENARKKLIKSRPKIKPKKFSLKVSTETSNKSVYSMNMFSPKAKRYTEWTMPKAEGWTVCRNRHSVLPSCKTLKS